MFKLVKNYSLIDFLFYNESNLSPVILSFTRFEQSIFFFLFILCQGSLYRYHLSIGLVIYSFLVINSIFFFGGGGGALEEVSLPWQELETLFLK